MVLLPGGPGYIGSLAWFALLAAGHEVATLGNLRSHRFFAR